MSKLRTFSFTKREIYPAQKYFFNFNMRFHSILKRKNHTKLCVAQPYRTTSLFILSKNSQQDINVLSMVTLLKKKFKKRSETECIYVEIALNLECQFNKSSFLQCYFLAFFLPAWVKLMILTKSFGEQIMF